MKRNKPNHLLACAMLLSLLFAGPFTFLNAMVPPAAIASSNSPVCTNSTLTLEEIGGEGVSWSWAGPNSFSASIANPVINNASTLNSGAYTVVVTGVDGSTNSATVDVVVLPIPMVTAPPNQVLGAGEHTSAVIFQGSPPGTFFKWTNDNPNIGLVTSGAGNINSFTAINHTNAPVVATITVTPQQSDDVQVPALACTNGLSVNITPLGLTSLYASDFIQYAADNCTPNNLILKGIRKQGTGTGFPTNPNGTPQINVIFDCDDLGAQQVEVWVMDEAGNTDFCLANISVSDNLGVCGQSPKSAGSEQVESHIATTLTSKANNLLPDCITCFGPPATFTITVNPPCLPAPSLGPGSVTTICPGDTATLVLEGLLPGQEAVWYADYGLNTLLYQSAANSFRPTSSAYPGVYYYALIYDNTMGCYSHVTIVYVQIGGNIGTIAGNVQTESGDGVEDAMVTITGPGIGTLLRITDNAGNYSFSGLPVNENYKIRVSKKTDPLNGVTTFDQVLVARHIMGIEALNSPYKMIASDVNGNGVISISDMVETRMLILGVITEFITSPSWKFVPADFVFPNPANPFSSPVPLGYKCVYLSCNLSGQDFIGIKMGDVNNTAVANN